MNYSKGITWFNDCRIPFVDEGDNTIRKTKRGGLFNFTDINERINGDTKGRFPANLLCSDDVLNDGNIVKSSNNWSNKTTLQSPYFSDEKQQIQKDTSYGDKGTNSRYYDIDAWFNNLINNI